MSNNVGIAFAFVIAAGAATALGATVVFVPSLVRFANRKTLAASMGLSAGVMLYVSFVEILVKSQDGFLEADHGVGGSAVYSTVCFFAGILCMIILNQLVNALTGGHHQRCPPTSSSSSSSAARKDESAHSFSCSSSPVQPHFICCSDDPNGELENVKQMAHEIEEYEQIEHENWGGHPRHDHSERAHGSSSNQKDEEDVREMTIASDSEDGIQDAPNERETSRKLILTSINTALAIALHNFPEGLVTFVATLSDPSVGAILAIAIALHNIPEGLCVAMPIYYATGNRWKAFGWALLSGASEPLAALLGWAFLANVVSVTVYAALFGIVAGMMVIISIKELLPTARRYDPEDTVVTSFVVIGMAVMSLSLVLFVA